MTTNELQMVLDAITKLGDAGQTAFIWWLVMDKLVPAVAWVITFAMALAVVCYAIRKNFPEDA